MQRNCKTQWALMAVWVNHLSIGGFNQRQGETLPPQIFLTLKFVVCIALKIIEIVAIWCDILGLKGSKFDFGWGSAPDPARGARSAPRPRADPIPALGPPGLETTCLPKYVSLNPPMNQRLPYFTLPSERCGLPHSNSWKQLTLLQNPTKKTTKIALC